MSTGTLCALYVFSLCAAAPALAWLTFWLEARRELRSK